MNRYILILGALLVTLASCEHKMPDDFDVSVNGIYFNYDGSSSDPLRAERNFAEYCAADSTEFILPLKIVTLGYIADHDRKVVIKSKSLESLPLADVDFPREIIIPAGASTFVLPVKIFRSSELQKQYGVIVYIDTQDAGSDFDEGIVDKAEFKILSEETYNKPVDWEAAAKNYYGEWTFIKHKFLILATKKQNIVESSNLKKYNRMAVDSLRRYYRTEPANPIIVEIPFYNKVNPMPQADDYDRQPYYWTALHNKYLGFSFDDWAMTITPMAFSYMANSLGISPANEREYFAGTEENLKKVHKDAVKLMMTTYNNFYNSKIDPFTPWMMYSDAEYYKGTFYMTLMADMVYELVQPAQWMGASAELVEKYYGPYSEAKYRFMLKVVVENSAMSKIRSYLPLLFPMKLIESNGSVAPGYTAETKFKEYNVIFKAALAASSETGFTFPDIPVAY